MDAGDDIEWLRMLMLPDHPRKAGVTLADRENDLESLYPVKRFRELLGLPDPAP